MFNVSLTPDASATAAAAVTAVSQCHVISECVNFFVCFKKIKCNHSNFLLAATHTHKYLYAFVFPLRCCARQKDLFSMSSPWKNAFFTAVIDIVFPHAEKFFAQNLATRCQRVAHRCTLMASVWKALMVALTAANLWASNKRKASHGCRLLYMYT